MEVTANISLKNGRNIGDKNISKITARSKRVNTTNFEAGVKVENYFNTYKAQKEPEGYIFREVRFNCGISGHYRSLRSLVLNTIINFGHDIEVHIDA